MSGCSHKRRIFIPHEDDQDLLVDLCMLCNEIQGTVRRGEPLGLGEDLGDPEGDEWDALADDYDGPLY